MSANVICNFFCIVSFVELSRNQAARFLKRSIEREIEKGRSLSPQKVEIFARRLTELSAHTKETDRVLKDTGAAKLRCLLRSYVSQESLQKEHVVSKYSAVWGNSRPAAKSWWHALYATMAWQSLCK
jgi:hypothetical protein